MLALSGPWRCVFIYRRFLLRPSAEPAQLISGRETFTCGRLSAAYQPSKRALPARHYFCKMPHLAFPRGRAIGEIGDIKPKCFDGFNRDLCFESHRRCGQWSSMPVASPTYYAPMRINDAPIRDDAKQPDPPINGKKLPSASNHGGIILILHHALIICSYIALSRLLSSSCMFFISLRRAWHFLPRIIMAAINTLLISIMSIINQRPRFF